MPRSRRHLLVVALAFASALPFADAGAGQVQLAWDPSPDSRVVGYSIHYGPLGGGFPHTYNAGNNVSATLDNLPDGSTMTFAVSAYDAVGTRSPFSNEVSAVVQYGPITGGDPSPPPAPTPTPSPTPTPTPPPTGESPHGTTIEPGSGSIVDDRGDTYTLSGEPGAWGLWQVYVNGQPSPWGWAGTKCVLSNHQVFCLAGEYWWYQDRDNGTGYPAPAPY